MTDKLVSYPSLNKRDVFNTLNDMVILLNGKPTRRDLLGDSGAIAIISPIKNQLVLIQQLRLETWKTLFNLPADLKMKKPTEGEARA